jgi:heme-binding protein
VNALAARRRKVAYAGLLGFATAMLFAQLITVSRTNPASDGELAAPPAVTQIIRRACYDCHSNGTRWPWYSRVAPTSWIVAHHVTAGRRQLNFSEWGGYLPRTRRHKLQWMARAVRDEQMPPWSYRLIHPESRLSESDRAALVRWIESEQTNLSNENGRR